MKIFIINLKRSINRRKRMERKMKELELAFQFYEGIDGQVLSQEELLKYIAPDHQFHRQFKRGEVGCFLSHYLLYKKIVEEKIPYALIMEDDIDISPRFPELLKIIETEIVPGEVISFYASFPEPCKLFKDKHINQHYNLIKPYSGQLVVGAVAYVITYKAAQSMMNNILPMYDVIDDWRLWLNRAFIDDFKIVFPHPIELTDMYSDVNESTGGFGLKIKKLIVNNNVPVLTNLILDKRKKFRWRGRINKILIDGQRPEILFF